MPLMGCQLMCIMPPCHGHERGLTAGAALSGPPPSRSVQGTVANGQQFIQYLFNASACFSFHSPKSAKEGDFDVSIFVPGAARVRGLGAGCSGLPILAWGWKQQANAEELLRGRCVFRCRLAGTALSGCRS